jgi:radical SAM protein with 4Fe4S-binding SPASM domain
MGILQRFFGRESKAIWRLEARIADRLGWAPPPQAVQWISTRACDLSCPHCYSHAGARERGELTIEEAKRLVVDALVDLGRPTLVIAGGETTLRKDFGAIVAYAHARGVPWAIHTHGGHVERLLDVFAAHPPVMAAVSVDGPRAYHDAFRGRAGSFDRAIAAIASLKRVGVREVVCGTTINRENADLLADLAPAVLASEADSWGFHLMTPEGRASGRPELLATPHQLRRAAAFGRRLRAVFHVELDNEWGSAGADEPFYRDEPFLCGAGRFSCVISATGEVMPCTTTDRAASAGNVRDRPLAAIWADGFRAFRKKKDGSPEADCDDCWLNTRHGVSARSAFRLGVFDPDAHARRLPLMHVPAGGAS